MWTAITRARKLQNVCVFIHSDEEVEKLTQSLLDYTLTIRLHPIKHKTTEP